MARERDINDILENSAEKVRERIDDVRETIEDAAEKAKSKGEEAWNDAMKLTQKHPAQALGIALVVGAALGVLLFGRNKD